MIEPGIASSACTRITSYSPRTRASCMCEHTWLFPLFLNNSTGFFIYFLEQNHVKQMPPHQVEFERRAIKFDLVKICDHLAQFLSGLVRFSFSEDSAGRSFRISVLWGNLLGHVAVMAPINKVSSSCRHSSTKYHATFQSTFINLVATA